MRPSLQELMVMITIFVQWTLVNVHTFIHVFILIIIHFKCTYTSDTDTSQASSLHWVAL